MLKRKLFHELRSSAGQFVTIFLMTMIAALAFAGVHAYMDGMADSADRYYKSNNLEDLWVSGESFSEEDLDAVKAVPNVKNAERSLAFQCTWIRDEGSITIETNFIETNDISRFHVFDGEDFDPAGGGLWLDFYLARALGVKVGDEIPLTCGGVTFTEPVRGLIGTPDHVYCVKDSSVIFTNHTDFGFGYLSASEFPEEVLLDTILKSEEMSELLSVRGAIRLAWNIAKLTGKSPKEFLDQYIAEETELKEAGETGGMELNPDMDLDLVLALADKIAGGTASMEEEERFLTELMPDFDPKTCRLFPQILVDADDTSLLDETGAAIRTALPDALAVTGRDLSLSWSAYQSEIEEGQTYSVIFMGMFLFIAILSVVTTMNRFVRRQRTQIGTLKALGFRRRTIILHYIGFGFITGLLGVVIGTLVGIPLIGKMFLKEEMDMFLVPEASVSVRPVVIAMDLLILAAITVITWLSCRKILKEPAAEALRVERPKVKVRSEGGRGLLKNASFSTKWNLRDIRRNKARSLMAIAGIAGSCTLIVGAFGMRDSLRNYLKWEFGGILHYEYQLSLRDNYTGEQFAALTEAYGNKTSETLAIELRDRAGTISTNIATINDAPDFLRLSDHNRNYFAPEEDGVYITEKLSESTGIAKGDTLRWHVLGEDVWYESPVIGLNRDPQNQQVNLSRGYAEEIGRTYRADTLFTNEDLSGTDELDGVQTISSVSDLAGQMNSMLGVMNTFILLLVFISALLGFVIIYNMGILSLMEKNYQFATLKVLGFRFRAIRKIFMEQNLWLTVISVIIGLPMGWLLADYIFKEAIGDRYDFFAMINLPTYLIGLIGTLAISVLSSLYLARKLKKIDMVSSLKANE